MIQHVWTPLIPMRHFCGVFNIGRLSIDIEIHACARGNNTRQRFAGAICLPIEDQSLCRSSVQLSQEVNHVRRDQ